MKIIETAGQHYYKQWLILELIYFFMSSTTAQDLFFFPVFYLRMFSVYLGIVVIGW